MNNHRFRLAILAIYSLAVGVTLFHHAMWRDEIQAWLIARDSADIGALFHNLRYEGHPALWHLMLMPLTRLSRDPVLMQTLHFCIAVTTIVLVLWQAPLSRFEQALFPFGYFMLFEYAVKARSYALGCLLIVLICMLWRHRRQHPLIMALLLALLANVHVLFMILSIAAVITLALDRVLSAPANAQEDRVSWRYDILACGIVLAGWVAAALTALPPSDSGFAVKWYFDLSFGRLRDTLGFSGALFRPHITAWAAVAALATLLTVAFRFRNNVVAACFLFASILGLLAFFHTKYQGSSWHHGLIFIVFFAALWIDRISPHPGRNGRSDRPLVPAALFGAVLVVQAYYGLRAALLDIRHPLSNGREVARFIDGKGWKSDPIIAVSDATTVPIIGYLGIDRAYFANGRRWGSFTIWDRKRLEPVDMNRTLEEAAQFAPNPTLVVAAESTIDPAILSRFHFEQVAKFSGASVSNENYTLYRHRTEN